MVFLAGKLAASLFPMLRRSPRNSIFSTFSFHNNLPRPYEFAEGSELGREGLPNAESYLDCLEVLGSLS